MLFILYTKSRNCFKNKAVRPPLKFVDFSVVLVQKGLILKFHRNDDIRQVRMSETFYGRYIYGYDITKKLKIVGG